MWDAALRGTVQNNWIGQRMHAFEEKMAKPEDLGAPLFIAVGCELERYRHPDCQGHRLGAGSPALLLVAAPELGC